MSSCLEDSCPLHLIVCVPKILKIFAEITLSEWDQSQLPYLALHSTPPPFSIWIPLYATLISLIYWCLSPCSVCVNRLAHLY